MRHTTVLLAIVSVVCTRPLLPQLVTGPSLLVTPQWLAQHQHDRDLVMLQVGPPAGYQKEHIAGSRFVQLRDIAAPQEQGALALEMPSDAALVKALESLGISDNSRIVVVFDSEWVSPSTRVLFTLGYVGLGDRAVLLDGGLAGWKKAGNAVTAEAPAAAAPGHITTRSLASLIVDANYITAHRNAPRTRIVDARDAQFYTGAPHMEMAGGHVPGAVSLPFGSMVTDDNYFLSRAQLDAKFASVGVQPGDTVVAYCHVGQQATVVLLAARLAGHPVKLYDGSYQDWSNRKLPTEGAKQ